MFLLRAAFWLSIVLLLIPGDPSTGTPAPRISALDALIAARGAIADLSGMCDRQPEVCINGGAALQAFGAKARDGVALLYQTLDGKLSAPTLPAPPASAPPMPPAAGTLTPDDAAPGWRAPDANGHKA
ncbi:DUF5330 domain-containing protein [Kaistia dalseonensis]|uniref:DUF5330 domain-containing protein n=1 Tax=Kaistia dalseonensis TaxID=410840 RepID=A0ABU0HD53_9HYPH|nr:DUF5330 domain-containing protein [Kaistia dalseonensis]MCX5497616.1 DUF5330 domain-containing protein [Kaistia dalseonensis]MDQ0440258.1 hypothetical protein [Kaistia dalseonensis]